MSSSRQCRFLVPRCLIPVRNLSTWRSSLLSNAMVLQFFLWLFILYCWGLFRFHSVLHCQWGLGRWKWLFLVRERGWWIWCKEWFVECGMNVPGWGKFQRVCWCSFLWDDEKWTCAFVVEFFLGSWEIEVGRVEPYLISYLILDCRSFLLSYWAFIWLAAFSRARLASSWIFCISETKVVDAGVRKGALGLAPGRMSAL